MSAALHADRRSRMRNEDVRQGRSLQGDERTFELPLGYVDESGRSHREVQLRPLSGHEQRVLEALPSSTPVATITTRLLACCLERLGDIHGVDATLVQELLIGDRDFLVLKLYQATFGERIHALLSCPAEDCAEIAEVLLDVSMFTVEAPPVEARTFSLRANEKNQIQFRLPCGMDQESLANGKESTEEQQIEKLLARCVLDSDETIKAMSKEEREQIENEMWRLAPRVEVELEAVCPKCSAIFTKQVDVPFLALTEMKVSESVLDRDVHALAFHYHWSQSEILSLTPHRRSRYIELLEEELERIAN